MDASPSAPATSPAVDSLAKMLSQPTVTKDRPSDAELFRGLNKVLSVFIRHFYVEDELPAVHTSFLTVGDTQCITEFGTPGQRLPRFGVLWDANIMLTKGALDAMHYILKWR